MLAFHHRLQKNALFGLKKKIFLKGFTPPRVKPHSKVRHVTPNRLHGHGACVFSRCGVALMACNHTPVATNPPPVQACQCSSQRVVGWHMVASHGLHALRPRHKNMSCGDHACKFLAHPNAFLALVACLPQPYSLLDIYFIPGIKKAADFRDRNG